MKRHTCAQAHVRKDVRAVSNWRPEEGIDTDGYLVGSKVKALMSHTTPCHIVRRPFQPDLHWRATASLPAALHSHWHFAQGSFSYSCTSTARLRTLVLLRSPPPSRTPPSRRRAASSLAYTPSSCVYRPYICVYREVERGEGTDKGMTFIQVAQKTHKEKEPADTNTVARFSRAL